jgi:hypothetical protein
MGNEFAIELSIDIPFGILKFTLSDEEVAILKLISCEEDMAIKYWEQLWKNIVDYEDLLFSCKELMPSAIKKIQTSCADGQWQQFIPKNAQFLAGLPRYTWTKNQYIINEYKKIASLLEKENIEFLALKGVCEMLDASPLAFMRTSRDIDILIHEEDWVKCKKVFNNLGWFQSEKSFKCAYLNSPIKGHAENFQNLERIFDLDVHFVAIAGAKSTSQKFTANLWKRKVKAKNFPNYYIPSPEDRYIIIAANIFGLHNWKVGHTTKYVQDLLTISTHFEQKRLIALIKDAEGLLKLGKFVEQSIKVVNKIKKKEIKYIKDRKYKLMFSISQNFLLYITYLLILIYLVKLIDKVSQAIHVITYLTSRVLLKVFYILTGKLFLNPIKESKKINSKSDSQNQFSVYLFPH